MIIKGRHYEHLLEELNTWLGMGKTIKHMRVEIDDEVYLSHKLFIIEGQPEIVEVNRNDYFAEVQSLLELRELLGMSNADFHDKWGISPQVAYQLHKRNLKLRRKRGLSLAYRFGISLDKAMELVGRPVTWTSEDL